jgi:glycosyltransferase involved in cell wall biosynthesis
MRVLQLHNHHASRGGAMEVLAHERLLLRDAGHAVDQLTLPAAEEMDLSPLRAGVKAVWNVQLQRELAARIGSFRPDVVHVHTPFPLMSPAVFRTARDAGVPTVATLHSYRYSCVAGTCVRDGRVCEDCVGTRLKLAGVRHGCYHGSRTATAALTLALVVHRAAGTFDTAVSRYLALTEFGRSLLVRDGYPAARIEVKPNSVPDPGFRAAPDAAVRRVVFAGRLIDIKGVRTLLEAWRWVVPGMRLSIAGDGPLRPLVEASAAADPSIEFLGWLEEPEVTALMASAHLVVVPSQWYEGAPLVIARSLGSGTPVLASDLENLSDDLLADGAGWSFATGDAAALAERLSEVARAPGHALALRPAARTSYEKRYSPEADLVRLERVYHDVVAEGAAR